MDNDELKALIAQKFDEENAQLLIKQLEHQEFLQSLKAQFDINIEILKYQDEELYNMFKDYTPSVPLKFISVDGVPDVIFGENSQSLYASSNLNPSEYCKVVIDNYVKKTTLKKMHYHKQDDYFGQIHYRYLNETVKVLDKYEELYPSISLEQQRAIPFFICFGVGLGYHIGELYSHLEINNLMIFEPNPDIFYASLYTFDWASLFKFISENRYLIKIKVGTKAQSLCQDLRDFIYSHGYYLPSIAEMYVHYETPEIIAMYNEMLEHYIQLNFALGFFDDQLFGVCHGIKNIIAKKSLIKTNAKLPEDICNLPVFIVANGPSLDNDLDFLRKNQDKALIFACGTAIDSLYQSGIKADFYISTERTKEVGDTLDLFNNNPYLDDVILLTSNVTHQNVSKRFKKSAIFLKNDEALAKLWGGREFHNDELAPITKEWDSLILMNPLTSNTAVSAAISLGFKTLYLFGVDNGTRSKDQLHSNASALYTKGESTAIVNTKTLTLSGEGNFGGEMITNRIYELSAYNISIVIDLLDRIMNSKTTVVNCSDGLKIDDTIAKRSSELSEFEKLDAIDKVDVLNRFMEIKTFTLDLSEDDFKHIIKFDRYKYLINFILTNLRKDFKDKMEILQTIELITEVMIKYAGSEDEFFCTLVEGSINSFFIQLVTGVCIHEDFEISKQIFNELVDILENFLEDSDRLVNICPNYIMYDVLTTLKKVGFDHENSKAPDMPESYEAIVNKDVIKEMKPFVKRYK